ncbi:MAG: AbrB/MazE/SpoVT family DNA-binding domain-containing protein [Acidimicrobiales bacterium]
MVIPKPIRDTSGSGLGPVVDIAEHEGRVEIAPAEVSVHLVEVGGALVATSTRELPPLTDDIVRETLERTRR